MKFWIRFERTQRKSVPAAGEPEAQRDRYRNRERRPRLLSLPTRLAPRLSKDGNDITKLKRRSMVKSSQQEQNSAEAVLKTILHGETDHATTLADALAEPSLARTIYWQLKNLEPLSDVTILGVRQEGNTPRAICLLDADADKRPTSDLSALDASKKLPTVVNLYSLLANPEGTVSRTLVAKTGAFSLLGSLVTKAVGKRGITAPDDRCSVFLWWWGYEIVIPQVNMRYLKTAHSVSGTILTFLQTLAVSGGIPELVPFLRYLSIFVEMQFTAMEGDYHRISYFSIATRLRTAQNQGRGVILAATWIFPTIVVPRPFDFEPAATIVDEKASLQPVSE